MRHGLRRNTRYTRRAAVGRVGRRHRTFRRSVRVPRRAHSRVVRRGYRR